MTIWRKGMLAVCVDAAPRPEHIPYYGRHDYCPLVVGQTYRVLAVIPGDEETPEAGLMIGVLPRVDDLFYQEAEDPFSCQDQWGASRFRPAVLNDTRAGRELIQLLDSPVPVTTNYDLVDMDEVGR